MTDPTQKRLADLETPICNASHQAAICMTMLLKLSVTIAAYKKTEGSVGATMMRMVEEIDPLIEQNVYALYHLEDILTGLHDEYMAPLEESEVAS